MRAADLLGLLEFPCSLFGSVISVVGHDDYFIQVKFVKHFAPRADIAPFAREAKMYHGENSGLLKDYSRRLHI